MRETKYRVWDKVGETMFDVITLSRRFRNVGMTLQWGGYLHKFPVSPTVQFPVAELEEDRYILLEYIGIKDKNKKEIYESDIVKGNFPYAKIGVVVWDKNRCGFYIKPINNLDNKAISDKYYKMNACKLEIIGNIYKNPKLLQEVKK